MSDELKKAGVRSNKIYLNLREESKEREMLRRELTYELPNYPSEYPKIVTNYSDISPTIISIPFGRLDLVPEGFTLKDKTVIVDADIPEPKFTLRDSQKEAHDWYEGSGIINAKPGWGKTVTALGIAYTSQLKTLVVAPNTTIRDMWIAEVTKWFGFRPSVIGGGKCDTSQCITVANIQTLNKYSNKLSAEFGLVILDECHHCPATTFTNFLNFTKATCRLGLSGTLKRKDGMNAMFTDFFGPERFVPPVENTIDPVIHLHNLEQKLPGSQFIPWAKRVNSLFESESYCKYILGTTQEYVKQGHKVLVVADRVDFLKTMSMSTERSVLITGETPKGVKNVEKYRAALLNAIYTGEADVVFATQSIFSEGISVNPLSCAILATPINNEGLLEQIAGRVMRQYEGKEGCVLVDIGLQGGTGHNQRRNRVNLYRELGWKMLSTSLSQLVNARLNTKKFKKFVDKD